jgi:hypothetical protein
MISSDLFTYNLDQHPFPPPPVKFAVEDPLPRAKVESAVGHGDDDFAPHDLPLQVRVGIVPSLCSPVPHHRCGQDRPRRCGCVGTG